MYFSFLPAAFFGAPPPMKDIVRRKALQSAPRSGRNFASEGALGDLWAVCRVVKSTARACAYDRLGQTTKPARDRTRHACQSAQQSPGCHARVMAQRVQEGARMPLLQDKHGQIRLNNPSSTGAKQYLVGSTDLPCWNSAHVTSVWAALSFDPAGRTVTRSQLLFAPDTWSPLSWRGSAAIACSTRRLCLEAPCLSQAPLL